MLRRTKSAAVAGLCALALGLAACSGSDTTADESKPLPTVTGNPAVTLDVFAPAGR